MPGCEVLLDNETWEPVEQLLANAGWQVRDEFFSTRVFWIVQDPI